MSDNITIKIQVSYNIKTKEKVETKKLSRDIPLSESSAMLILKAQNFVLSQESDQFNTEKDIMLSIISSYINIETQVLYINCKIRHIIDLTIDETSILPLLNKLTEQHNFIYV